MIIGGLEEATSPFAYLPQIISQKFDVWDKVFSSLGEGLVYDLSDMSTVFQNANGLTPSVPGSPVGLMLDKSRDRGPDIKSSGVTKVIGTVSEPPTYDPATGVGSLRREGDAQNASTLDFLDLGADRVFAFDIEHIGGSETTIREHSVAGGNGYIRHIIPVGERVTVLVVGFHSYMLAPWNNDQTTQFTIHSVREIIGHTISQPTTAQRPMLARLPKTGERRNLLGDVNFSNSSWSKGNCDVTDLGDGIFRMSANSVTPVASYITGSGINAVLNTGNRSFSVDVKADNSRWVVIGHSNATTSFKLSVDLTTGEVLYTNPGSYETSVEELEDGWFRLHFFYTPVVNGGPRIVLSDEPYTSGSGNIGSILASVGASVLIRRPQVDEGNIPTPYQAVNNDYDITEQGVPSILQIVGDGVDDNLNTTLPNGEYTKLVVNGKGELHTFANHVVSGPENIVREDGTHKVIYYKPDGPTWTGPELMTNPDFSDGLDSYTLAGASGGASMDLVDGKLHFIGFHASQYVRGPAVTKAGKIYEINVTVDSIIRGTPRVAAGLGGSPTAPINTGNNRVLLPHTATTGSPYISGDTECVISHFSVREVSFGLPVPLYNRIASRYGSEPVVDMLKGEEGLAIDFVTGKAFVRGGGKDQLPRDINGFLNYASPSTKYVRNRAGILEAGTALRCDHDAEGNPLGLLIEGQRTNLAIWSEDFTQWTKIASGIDVVSNNEIAPDGTLTADKIIPPAETGGTSVYRQVNGLTPTTTYSFSARVKASGFSAVQLDLSSSFGTSAWANFDLSTGTLGLKGPAVSAHSIKALGNGWFECSISANTAGGTAGFTHILAITDVNSGGRHPSVTGDGTSGILLWGAQLEQGDFPTSYIKTEDSQVTRAADIVSLATAMFPFNQQAGTLIAEVIRTDNTAGIAILSDGTTNNQLSLSAQGKTAYLGYWSRSGGVIQADIYANTTTPYGTHKQAGAYAMDDFTYYVNGLHIGADNSGLPPSNITTLRLGFDRANRVFDGHIKSLVYIPRRLSDAELIARTTP